MVVSVAAVEPPAPVVVLPPVLAEPPLNIGPVEPVARPELWPLDVKPVQFAPRNPLPDTPALPEAVDPKLVEVEPRSRSAVPP